MLYDAWSRIFLLCSSFVWLLLLILMPGYKYLTKRKKRELLFLCRVRAPQVTSNCGILGLTFTRAKTLKYKEIIRNIQMYLQIPHTLL